MVLVGTEMAWIHVLRPSRLYRFDTGGQLHGLCVASVHQGTEEEMCYCSQSTVHWDWMISLSQR